MESYTSAVAARINGSGVPAEYLLSYSPDSGGVGHHVPTRAENPGVGEIHGYARYEDEHAHPVSGLSHDVAWLASLLRRCFFFLHLLCCRRPGNTCWGKRGWLAARMAAGEGAVEGLW